MNDKLKALAATQGGIVTRRQVLDAGWSDLEIEQHLKNKRWVGVRRGAYAERDVWQQMTLEDQHRARVHAVVLRLGGTFAVSHTSASAMYELPLWDVDLDDVHVTRPAGASPRHEAGVWHHSAALTSGVIAKVGTVPVTTIARTVIDTARICGFESAVIVADAALHRELATTDELLDTINLMRDWPGARNAGRVVEFADGRAESVGESRTRVSLDTAGLPRPELQVVLSTGDRVDFLIKEYKTVIEFDGRQKYGRSMAPGEDLGDVVWREKKREDRIRELGYEVIRIIWSELTKISVIRRRAFRAFARAGGRHEDAA